MESTTLRELFLLGRVLWILVLTLLVLAYVTVFLRLWVRYRITKSAGHDDLAMVATLVHSATLPSFGMWNQLISIDTLHMLLRFHHCYHAAWC